MVCSALWVGYLSKAKLLRTIVFSDRYESNNNNTKDILRSLVLEGIWFVSVVSCRGHFAAGFLACGGSVAHANLCSNCILLDLVLYSWTYLSVCFMPLR